MPSILPTQLLAFCSSAWLYRGAQACPTELCTGTPTSRFLSFALGRLALLEKYGVKPLVVFDGSSIPAKRGRNNDRRVVREAALERATQAMARGDSTGAKAAFCKAVCVTHEMAYQLVEALRKRGTGFLISPYEADAQLAYLSRTGLIDVVITEDSDSLVFGCQRVLFKLESDGHGKEIQLRNLGANVELSFVNWTPDMFLDMCLLAGCDYLPSIPGLGIKTAHRMVKEHRTPTRLLEGLSKSRFRVPEGFYNMFWYARATFRHMRVYDPQTEEDVFLTPVPEGEMDRFDGDLGFLGPALPSGLMRAVATGEVHPVLHRAWSEVLGTAAPRAEEALREDEAQSEAGEATHGGVGPSAVSRPGQLPGGRGLPISSSDFRSPMVSDDFSVLHRRPFKRPRGSGQIEAGGHREQLSPSSSPKHNCQAEAIAGHDQQPPFRLRVHPISAANSPLPRGRQPGQRGDSAEDGDMRVTVDSPSRGSRLANSAIGCHYAHQHVVGDDLRDGTTEDNDPGTYGVGLSRSSESQNSHRSGHTLTADTIAKQHLPGPNVLPTRTAKSTKAHLASSFPAVDPQPVFSRPFHPMAASSTSPRSSSLSTSSGTPVASATAVNYFTWDLEGTGLIGDCRHKFTGLSGSTGPGQVNNASGGAPRTRKAPSQNEVPVGAGSGDAGESSTSGFGRGVCGDVSLGLSQHVGVWDRRLLE